MKYVYFNFSTCINILFSAEEIFDVGKKLLGDQFYGVYPLNRMPILKPGGFIINTQSSNLPGEHWIAVFVKPDVVKVFDPMGFYYPAALVEKIERVCNRVEYK